VNAIDVVESVEEIQYLLSGVGEVAILVEVHLLFFNGSLEAFRGAVFTEFTSRRHAESYVEFYKRST